MRRVTLALILLTTVFCKVDWKKMSSTTLSYKTIPEVRFFTGDIALTFVKDGKKTQSTSIVPDFTQLSTIIGYKGKGFDWGIDCKGNDDDKCYVDDKATPSTGSYFGSDYSYLDGRTVANFPGSGDFSGENVGADTGFKIRLLTDTAKSTIYKEHGVLGMAPNSDFYDYILNNFNFGDDQKTIETGVIVFSQDGLTKEAMKGETSGTFDNSNLFMNGHNDDKVNTTIGINTATILEPTEDMPYWALGGMTLQLATETETFKQTFNRVCFAPHYRGTFGILQDDPTTGPFTTFNNSVNALITDSDFSKVPKLVASLSVNDGNDNLMIQFRNEEFIIEANGGVGTFTVFQAASDHSTMAGCKGADLILGRLFFQRNYVIFYRDIADVKNSKIGITQYLPLDKITNSERNVLLGFGLFMITLILIALIVRCTGGKGEEGEGEEDGGYAKV